MVQRNEGEPVRDRHPDVRGVCRAELGLVDDSANRLSRARADRYEQSGQSRTRRGVRPLARPHRGDGHRGIEHVRRHRRPSSTSSTAEKLSSPAICAVSSFEASLRVLGCHAGATPPAASGADWNDGRRRLAVTEDQDLLTVVLRLIDHFRKVGFHVCERALLHVTNMISLWRPQPFRRDTPLHAGASKPLEVSR